MTNVEFLLEVKEFMKKNNIKSLILDGEKIIGRYE